MITQSTVRSTESNLLKRVLLANSVFSTLSGIICIIAAPALTTFLGLPTTIPMFILGVLLLLFAFDVYLIAKRTPIEKNKATIVLIADILWVIASAVLLIADPFSFTTQGRWAILILADVVAVFAILEFIGLRAERER
jgi:hypothetical protein